jgi:hypothetical protein
MVVETMLLLVALAAFAVLVVGWMMLPDASVAEKVPEAAVPARRAAEAA